MIYTAGTSYKIHNIRLGEVKMYFSRDGGGIGSVAVDQKRKYFAVAEKGTYPGIYVYEYPSLRLYRVMRHGTEKSYSSVSFSLGGDKLASVGSEPDYNICIWDWRNEILVLKAKAFSQEVFRVVFSDHSDTILSTCGMAHLRFWKIANTFTGLKLKGQTGKFGSVELSDITGFYIFPDGKVLSGSENGQLLLWEGNLIKAVLGISEEQPCHAGVINTVIKIGDSLVSAGKDGFVKYWDFRTIDDIEANDDLSAFISPTREFLIVSNPDAPEMDQKPANIMEIVVYEGYWLVHDASGKLFKVKLSTGAIQQDILMSFNSGKLKGIAGSRNSNAVATIGTDGVVRLHDFVDKKEYYSRSFKGEGTCIDWLSMTFNHRDRFVAVGYTTGVVRIIHFSKEKVYLVKSMKVHNNPVASLCFSPSGETLAVLSSQGEIFFLAVEPAAGGGVKIDPICIHPINMKVNYMSWGQTLNTLLLATESGQVIELEVPKLEDFDSTFTYLNESIKSRSFTIKMMEFQKPKIDENDINFLLDDKVVQQEVEWDPAPISSVAYLEEEKGEFICSVEGEYAGHYYKCRFGEERPVDHVPSSPSATRLMIRSGDGKYLITGTDSGEVFVRPVTNLEVFGRLQNHDQNMGRIVGVVMNPEGSVMCTGSEDATMMARTVDMGYLKNVVGYRIAQLADRERKRNNRKRGIVEAEDEEGEKGEEGDEEESEEESGEERKLKTDQFDIAIGKLEPVMPETGGPIGEEFFFDDVAREDATDILDDRIYSIQEEKLLAEEDRRKSIAEEKKRQLREDVGALREEFEGIKKYDGELDKYYRLEFKDFNLDEEYYSMLKERVGEMLDEATKEVSWSIEYHRLKTEKLRGFFLSDLEFDRVAVKAFKKIVFVTSMRVKRHSEYTLSKWAETGAKAIGEEYGDEGSRVVDVVQNEAGGAERSLLDEWLKQENRIPIDQNYLKRKKDALRNSNEQASKERFTRQMLKESKEKISRMRQELKEREPKSKAKAPEENEEVKKARSDMGDYKLKSDKGYEVPTKERMSMKKQKKMIFLYEELVYSTKGDFNTNVMEMRERKKELFEKILKSNERLKVINEQLGVEEILFVPEWDNELEFPENAYQVSQEEIDELARQKEEEKKNKKGRFGADEKGEEHGEEVAEKDVKKQRVELQYKERKNIRTQTSELEREMEEIKVLRLKTEKDILVKELEDEVKRFDEDLEELANSKIRLEYEMKFTQMTLVTAYQELIILDAFEKKDEMLLAEHEKLKLKDKENTENLNKIVLLEKEKGDSLKTLDVKMKDAEAKFNEKETNLNGIANSAYQIYKANQKRHKNNQNPEDDGGDMDAGLDDDDDVCIG